MRYGLVVLIKCGLQLQYEIKSSCIYMRSGLLALVAIMRLSHRVEIMKYAWVSNNNEMWTSCKIIRCGLIVIMRCELVVIMRCELRYNYISGHDIINVIGL